MFEETKYSSLPTRLKTYRLNKQFRSAEICIKDYTNNGLCAKLGGYCDCRDGGYDCYIEKEVELVERVRFREKFSPLDK